MAAVTADQLIGQGVRLQQYGQLRDAEEQFRQALQLNPQHAPALHLLGLLLHRTSRSDAGLVLLHRAVELAPGVPDFHNNLGSVLGERGDAAGAVAAFARAIRLQPDDPNVHSNMGAALQRQQMNTEAVAAYRRAVELLPDSAKLHAHLAGALMALGQPEEAIAAYRRAVALAPSDAALHSALLYALYYDPSLSDQALFAEHLTWAKRHTQPLASTIAPHSNDPDPARRLRVGYVSADFRRHSTAVFMEPIITSHDPASVEIYCYSDVLHADNVTKRFEGSADVWRPVSGMGDEQLASLIRQDRIDILVDPSSHMGHSRMLTFARKPAPLQFALSSYGTSGLATMDYFLTDAYENPIGSSEAFYTECLLRLEGGPRCYRPPDNSPEVNALPADRDPQGAVTFGSLNRLAKVTSSVFELWARVLQAVPGSRLLVLGASTMPDSAQYPLERAGVVDRVEWVGPRRSELEYLRLFRRVDIALDPFPYNGCTTTCDALWMGVPTITLVGTRCAARVGLSALSNAGLPDLAAHSAGAYVQAAAALAADRPRLRVLRGELRESIRRSPLCDAPGFTRTLEAAFRHAWRQWCTSSGRSRPD